VLSGASAPRCSANRGSSSTHPLPIAHRLLPAPCLGIVVCQQLGLGGGSAGKLCLQHLRHVPLVPLAGPLKYGLIGCLLHRGMLKVDSGLVMRLNGQREVLIVVLTIIPGKSRCLAITIRPKILRESSRQAT